jgi:flagellar biosynthesis chaperone FliJ
MKSELKMQYLNLKLKIGGMVARMQEYQGTLVQKQAELDDLQQKLHTKSEELAKSQRRLKELEKNFKKSDNFAKIVASTDNTAGPTAELKQKLEEYITKIDHCIDQLRNP